MKQTEHYGLNQWELPDRVQMQDFNADNAKIDGLLHCHPSGELLAELKITEETTPLEIDLTPIDWSRYLMLILRLETSTTEEVFIGMNSPKEGSIYIYELNDTAKRSESVAHFPTASRVTMVVPVLYSGDHAPEVLAFGLSDKTNTGSTTPHGLLSGGGSGKLLNQCGKIVIDRNRYPFHPGDYCALWGVK